MKTVQKRAKVYLSKIPAAISGKGGCHNATLKVAVVLVHGFAMSNEEAWPLLLEFNARCEPPWTVKELAHKLEDARKLDRYPLPYGHLLEGGGGGNQRRTLHCKVSVPVAQAPRVIGRVVLPEDLSTRLPPPIRPQEAERHVQLNFNEALRPKSELEEFKEQAREFCRQLRLRGGRL